MFPINICQVHLVWENLLLKQKLWGLPLSTLQHVRRRGQRREPAQGCTPQPSTVWDLLQWQGKKPQASAGSFSELLVGCLRMLPIYSFYCQAGSVKLLKWITASLFSDTNPEKALSPRKGFSALCFVSFFKHTPPVPSKWAPGRSLPPLLQAFKMLRISTLSHTTISFHQSVYAPWLFSVVLCHVAICYLLFALWKRPWNQLRSFSLASSAHVMSANRQGDEYTGKEAVVTLPFVSSSSPAVCHIMEALVLHSACYSYCGRHNWITASRVILKMSWLILHREAVKLNTWISLCFKSLKSAWLVNYSQY